MVLRGDEPPGHSRPPYRLALRRARAEVGDRRRRTTCRLLANVLPAGAPSTIHRGRCLPVMNRGFLFASLLASLVVAVPFALRGDDPSLAGRDGPERRDGVGPGMWGEAPEGAAEPELSARQRALIQQLQAIGYVSGSTPSPRQRRDRESVRAGLRRAQPLHLRPRTRRDPDGHGGEPSSTAGTSSSGTRFPIRPGSDHSNTEWWRRAYLYPNGDVLAIFEGFALVKLDANSNLIWASPVARPPRPGRPAERRHLRAERARPM